MSSSKAKGEEELILLPNRGLPLPPAAPAPCPAPRFRPHQGTKQLAWRWLGSSDQTPLSRGPKCLHWITASAVWSMRVSKPVFRTAEKSKVEALCDIPPSFRPRSILDWIHAFLLMEMPKDNKSVLLESTKGTQKCVLMPTCHWN